MDHRAALSKARRAAPSSWIGEGGDHRVAPQCETIDARRPPLEEGGRVGSSRGALLLQWRARRSTRGALLLNRQGGGSPCGSLQSKGDRRAAPSSWIGEGGDHRAAPQCVTIDARRLARRRQCGGGDGSCSATATAARQRR